jgi:hypothetical protein
MSIYRRIVVTNTAVAHPRDLDGRSLVRELTHRINKNNLGSARAKSGRVRKRTVGWILRRHRRLGRGKREEPGSDCGSRPANALYHGDHPDDSAAKLSPAVFGVCGCAPRLIGVVMALLPSGAPLGFVAILGVLALIGILIRNSVILIAARLAGTASRSWNHIAPPAVRDRPRKYCPQAVLELAQHM